MTETRTKFTPEEALNYAAANQAIRSGDVRRLAQLLAENPGLVHIRGVGGDRTLFNQLADWPGRWPRRLESAALLIAAGADINARAGIGEHHETTLQEAASCYDAALCELIVEAGASPDGLNDDRRPMAEALFYRAPAAATVLADHGATIDLEFAAGRHAPPAAHAGTGAARAGRRERAAGTGARLRGDQRPAGDGRVSDRSWRRCQRGTLGIHAPNVPGGLGRREPPRIRAVPRRARRPPPGAR